MLELGGEGGSEESREEKGRRKENRWVLMGREGDGRCFGAFGLHGWCIAF